MLAMQIVALTIELIDDFAAYCFAFYLAKKDNSKNVAEYLRDWSTGDTSKTGSATRFFQQAAEDLVFVAEVSGLDPIANWAEAADLKARINALKIFRDFCEGWYQGYKHGQRAIPASFTIYPPSHPNKTVWGIFMIPEKLTKYPDATTNTSKVYVDMTVSFLSITEKAEEAYQKAQEVYQLWRTIRARVHRECFGNPPP
jgi:hypothetical protein